MRITVRLLGVIENGVRHLGSLKLTGWGRAGALECLNCEIYSTTPFLSSKKECDENQCEKNITIVIRIPLEIIMCGHSAEIL